MKTIFTVKENDNVVYVSYDIKKVSEFINNNAKYYSVLTVEEDSDSKLFVVLCSNIRRHKGLYGTRVEVYRSYKEYKEFMYGGENKYIKKHTTYKFNDEKDCYDKQVKELLSKVEKEFGKDYILYGK